MYNPPFCDTLLITFVINTYLPGTSRYLIVQKLQPGPFTQAGPSHAVWQSCRCSGSGSSQSSLPLSRRPSAALGSSPSLAAARDISQYSPRLRWPDHKCPSDYQSTAALPGIPGPGSRRTAWPSWARRCRRRRTPRHSPGREGPTCSAPSWGMTCRRRLLARRQAPCRRRAGRSCRSAGAGCCCCRWRRSWRGTGLCSARGPCTMAAPEYKSPRGLCRGRICSRILLPLWLGGIGRGHRQREPDGPSLRCCVVDGLWCRESGMRIRQDV